MRNACAGQLYRVWIVGYEAWTPRSWNDVPPRMVALEPAEKGCLTGEGAAIFVAAYNEAMLDEPRDRWAVSVPVKIRYDGDLEPGQAVDASDVARLEQDGSG